METYITCGKLKFRIETVFCICFLIYTLLSFNSFTYGKRCISVFLYLTLLLGTVTLTVKICKKGIPAHQIEENILFGLFLLTVLTAVIWNGAENSLKDNIIKLIFQIFFFFILYDTNLMISPEYREKEFWFLTTLLNLYLFIGAIASLWLMWSGYSTVNKMPGGWAIGIGFVWGRLWGIYSEPNYITIVSVIVILFNLYMRKRYRSKAQAFLSRINMIAQFLFICFSDSRTGAVALGMTLGVCFFNSQIYKNIARKKSKRCLIPTLFMTIAIIISGIILPRITTKAYNTGIHYVQSKIKQPQKAASKAESLEMPVIDRGYDVSADPSNRRFSIWKSGIEIFITTPFIGTSFSNILGYTEDAGIDTYIVNNGDEKFSTIHNEVLNILVSQGIFGLIILFLLIFVILAKILPWFYQTDPDEFRKRNFLFSSLVSIVCGSMFLTGMFYSNSPSTILFWYFLGYLMFLIQASKGDPNDCQCLLDTVSDH